MTRYKNFEEFKAETIKLAAEHGYCQESKDALEAATKYVDIINHAKKWLVWSYEAGWFTEAILNKLDPQTLYKNGIYFNADFNEGHGLVTAGTVAVFGDAEVIVTSGEVLLSENAKAYVYGDENCIIRASGKSKIISNGLETIHAEGRVFIKRNGVATIFAKGQSTVYSRGNENVKLEGDSIYKRSKQ